MAEISVIMSTHNGEKTISEAIQSIINQSYKDWEMIICDDCSNDRTAEILKHFSERDNRIKIITNSCNKKLAYSLNECIRIAEGKYIARMDDDDYSTPDRFIIQMEFLEKNLEYAVVGSNIELFNSYGKQGVRTYPKYADLKHQPYKIVQFAHPAIMIRKSVLDSLKGYTVASYTERGQDFDLWARFFAAGFIGYNIQECLLEYRISDKGYKKGSFRNAKNSVVRHIKCYKLLHFPIFMYIRVFDPVITYIIPTRIMTLWHRRKIK